MSDPDTFAKYDPVDVLDAWDAVQARKGKVIDVGKRRGKPMSEWTVKESLCALFALLVLGTVVPAVILFGGIMLLGLFSVLTAH